MAVRQDGQLSLADSPVTRRGKSSVILDRLDELVDWSRIAAESRYGAPGYSPLLMLKALLLQQWYELSDPGLEDALVDRLSFRRFAMREEGAPAFLRDWRSRGLRKCNYFKDLPLQTPL